MKNRTDEWAYKVGLAIPQAIPIESDLTQIPFAVQWFWPVPIFVLVTFAPESPWFLVRQGRLEEAQKAVARLGSRAKDVDPAQTVAMMVRTNEIEIKMHEGVSYWVSWPLVLAVMRKILMQRRTVSRVST